MCMSSMPIDSPDSVAYRKPMSFRSSRKATRHFVAEAVIALGDERADLLLLELLVDEAEGLRTTSLRRVRPTVVSMTPPL